MSVNVRSSDNIGDTNAIVRRHSSKFQANCVLFDTSMKFGTLKVFIKTGIFEYSAKLELSSLLWKPLFISIHGISLFFADFCKCYHFSELTCLQCTLSL